jgi:poly(A) polymerase
MVAFVRTVAKSASEIALATARAAAASTVAVPATFQPGRAAVVEQLERLDVPRFPVGGEDLIAAGLRPGPVLGAELERLERLWIEGGFTLDRDALLALARR